MNKRCVILKKFYLYINIFGVLLWKLFEDVNVVIKEIV